MAFAGNVATNEVQKGSVNIKEGGSSSEIMWLGILIFVETVLGNRITSQGASFLSDF